MSKLETNTIDTISGTNTLQVGDGNVATINLGKSGDTINVPSGVTIANSGTATGFGANTPAFSAYAGSDQNGLTDDTYTKLAMNTEFYDTDGKYDTSNYRFTPTVAGKYNFGACVYIDGSTAFTSVNLALYKNGSQLFYVSESVDSTTASTINATIELDDNDYVELYAKADVDGGGTWNLNQDGTTANNRCFWFGYKLI